ncbi:MAG: cation diffusion facilitator family transporter [Candidatus Burarchaeum sp.]|nr:cation diffusion facilitator family transporter [Candidatus Burarchaeum sp.]MDO8339419.1 cation diffusion facilitator family transporter [Candidatus Burarchaeum sp.]
MVSGEMLRKEFRIFIYLSGFVLLLELLGGYFTNSLALMSDAGHVATDLLALLLAYVSMQFAGKAPDRKFTFGYGRAEIFAAAVNGIFLVGITAYIFYQAYDRLVLPQAVRGPEMLLVAVIGLIGNLYVAVRMHDYGKENLNVRGAYLHVLSDTLSSVGVILAGGLIILTGNYIFDPIISFIIGVLILIGSLQLLREAAHIFMESVPSKIDLGEVEREMRKISGVAEVHDLHVWSLTSDKHALSAHILIDAENLRAMNRIVEKTTAMLESKYGITHTAIQSECERCAGKHSH